MRLINLFADGVLLRHDGPRHKAPMVNTIRVGDMCGTPMLQFNAFFAHAYEERIVNIALNSLGVYFKRQGNFNTHALMAMGIEAQSVLDTLRLANDFTDIKRPVIGDRMHDIAQDYAAKTNFSFGKSFTLQQSPFPQ